MRSRRHLFLGALVGVGLFAVGTAITITYDQSSRPSFVPLTLVFWYYSGFPIHWIAYHVLGPYNAFARFGGLACGLVLWVAAGVAVGALIRRIKGNRSPHSTAAEYEPPARARRRYAWLIALVPVIAILFWPVHIPVSGLTTVRIIHPDGSPFVSLPVEESWYVEGYGERGNQEVARTNERGSVIFPPRLVWGWAGLRKVKRFLAETSATATQRWGPYLHIIIRMPEGYWVPRDHGEPIPDDLMVTYQDLGGPRYLTVENIDPRRVDAFITSRDPGAFLGDLTLVLNLRQATSAETRILDGSKHRQEVLAERLKR